jgi:hypothetical protein
MIAALADGAGSAERSDEGARLASSLAVNFIHQAFDEGACVGNARAVLRNAAAEARLALEKKSEALGCGIDEFASTLQIAVLSSNGSAFGQIGDCAIVIDEGENGWTPVHWPDHGEYANTTRFLTEADGLDALRIEMFERPPRRIAMFSDGLERLVLDFQTRKAHAPFFDSILSRLCAASSSEGEAGEVSAEIAALLGSDKVNSRTDDDKVLLCAALIGT